MFWRWTTKSGACMGLFQNLKKHSEQLKQSPQKWLSWLCEQCWGIGGYRFKQQVRQCLIWAGSSWPSPHFFCPLGSKRTENRTKFLRKKKEEEIEIDWNPQNMSKTNSPQTGNFWGANVTLFRLLLIVFCCLWLEAYDVISCLSVNELGYNIMWTWQSVMECQKLKRNIWLLGWIPALP